MEDNVIVDLYWNRDEQAITQSDVKYGKMLRSISSSCLTSDQDVEECVNDTYLSAWNQMPVDRPTFLGAYLSKIVRHISIDRYRHDHAKKRGQYDSLTEELEDCIPDSESNPEKELENSRLKEALDVFLAGLDQNKRVIFVLRYFYTYPVETVAAKMGMSTSNVKVTLHRIRRSLKEYLEKEDLM